MILLEILFYITMKLLGWNQVNLKFVAAVN